VLDLLRTWPTPEALRHAGRRRIGKRLTKLAPRMGERLAGEIIDALDQQTVTVVGTNAVTIVLPQLARMLADIRESRDTVFTQVEAFVEAHPLHPVLTSLPAVGVRTAARILTEVVGKDFASAGHLASYAGLAPVTWRSGSSIRGDHPSRKGNKILKRDLFLSAFAALKDPLSRAYYDRKRAEGKRHDQALIALARRRCDTLYAMLRDGTLYEPRTPSAA
jgi:transposase